MRKKRAKYLFSIYVGSGLVPYNVLANHPAQAVSIFCKSTGRRVSLHPDSETGGWKGLSVSLAK